jgi:sugar phosphate isomerase/epimerase
MIKLGVNTVLFGQRDLRTVLRHIQWAGYDAAEIAALGQMANHLPLPDWRERLDAIRAAVDEAGLPLSAAEVGGIQRERVLPALEACAELGIPVINVGPGGFKPDDPAEIDRLADILNELCAEAEKAGIALCLKAHVNTAVHNTPTTLEIMKRVQSPAFGIDMDPSHIHRGGENPAEALKQVVHRVKHVHIRDCKGPGPRPGAPEEQACGRGDIDLAAYCRVLVEAGYDGPVNLEVIGARDYELSRQAIIAAESYGFLNAVLKMCGGR